MNATLVITRLTFREASRRKILLAALLLGLVFLIVFGIGFYYIHREAVLMTSSGRVGSQLQAREISNFLLMAGLYVVNFLTAMMAVLTSVDTISGEIASGTIHTLLAKPVRRWEVVLGKWLGYAGMLTLYLLLMAGGVMLLVYALAGYTAPNALRGFGLLWLNAMVLLTVSILGGTMFSTLANGVLVFGLFGVAFLGGWIEQIGAFLNNLSASRTAINIGILTSLIMPSEAIWKRVAYEMQSPLVAALGVSPFSARTVPSPFMIGYAVIYLLAALLLAIRRFRRRDM
jgi:ABC-type transport system involved in multi-copper enzyme maturation permease subunit